MSFVWKRPEGRLKTPEQVAKEVLEVAVARGLDDFAAVLGVMCIAQESDFWCPWNAKDPVSKNYAFDSESNDGRSVAYFQQQNKVPGENPTGPGENWWGTMASRMDLKRSCDVFLTRLQDDYHTDSPAQASEIISNVQSPRPDLRGAYAKHWGRAHDLVNAAKGQVGSEPKPPPPAIPGGIVVPRPDFNEINEIGLDWNGRGYNHASPRSRPPINWFLHTQEGNGNATDLSRYLRSTSGNGAVSYHYTIHEDLKDHGVTVVDVVDTDYYSWSVLDANVFSINACFAGSRAAATRDEWLAKYKNAIRVAAYLAVEDCKKYTTLSSNVILPPYQSGAGIADHRYVTKCLGIGNHTDVGGPMTAPWLGFPWDWFVECVHEFNGVPTGAPPIAVPPVTIPATDRQLLEQIAADAAECRAQLGDGHPDWASKGMTLRDRVWSIPTAPQGDS